MPTTTLTTFHLHSVWRSMSWLNSDELPRIFSRVTTAGNRVWNSVRRTGFTRCLFFFLIIFGARVWWDWLFLTRCVLLAGRHAVRGRVEGHRAGRGAAVLVPAAEQEGMFCCMLVLVLWPPAARRGAGDLLEAQHHGLFYAILHSGHERTPQ